MKKFILSVVGAAVLFTSVPASTYASEVSIENEVKEVLGTPYLWGGTTAAGFDCTGFILYILDKFNAGDLPRTSQSQAKVGTPVSKDDLRVGDLVFFNTFGTGISHAGIYVGDDQFAHSSSSKGVRISRLSESYYRDRYVTARRVVSETSYLKMISE
ncbi:hydrolase [Paenibacillus sp. VTT E-133280]|uniref:C40 family peptidase n=1 Tax=unclassified Paenibacillus TaxID=185978 RepID=UPI000BA044EC|nr:MULTISPECIES: C40 family peptidase [unclassified Paenibacillus]MBY3621397.1 C40 family peptidase [Acinetobacter sp. CUI P1]OZQ60330.1 hydrolase [Paenibacillus sp. VTT E-133280]